MPIWAKLGLIMIPPVLATLVIGTNGLLDNLDTVSNADTTRVLSQLVKESGTLVDGLQNERAAAVITLADDDPKAQEGLKAAFAESSKIVDTAVQSYNLQRNALQGSDAGMSDLLQRIDGGVSGLTVVRSQVNERKITISDLGNRYQVLIAQLLEIRERAAQIAGSSELGDALRAAAAVANYKEFLSEERIVVHHAFDQGQMTPYLRKNFIATETGQNQALRTFEAVAPESDVDLYTGTVTGPALRKAKNYEGIVEALPEGTAVTAFNAAEWDLAMKDHAALVRKVEANLDQKVESTAGALRDQVTTRILVQTGLVFGMLVIAVLAAWLVARSMARSLRELRHGALQIAQYGLPHAVERLRNPAMTAQMSPIQVANQIAEPLPVRSKDEFGQVTEAFNAVHLEAVRTAAEQAALRSSVATMFVNLARRSQILVDRLIGHLDRLERGEEDPDRLAELFQLDHLATRMRRNDENLLVLAGADSTRVQREPAALLDVLRAAQSEVEHYTRIEFGIVDRDIEVAAHAVNDLVHLIAELFDNATAFSPPDSTVMVEARRVGDRSVLYVEDKGIGMSPDMLADVNERLATPPMVDVAVSRMMGLVVVARLAGRHGVKVELRSSSERGIIADVTLPTAVLVPRALAGRAGAPSREASVPAIESRQPQPPQQQMPPQRSSFGPPLAIESGGGNHNNRMYDTPAPTAMPPMPAPTAMPPMPAPMAPPPAPAAPPSRGGMPVWSDLTGASGAGAGAGTGSLNGDPLPRRAAQPNDDPRFNQIPRQTQPPVQERSPYDMPPPATQTPISAVPVSAVPVSTPPSVPPPAAPPVWPPVADQPPNNAQTGEFPRVNSGSPSVVPQHIPYADETMELPIFRELESAWFSTRRSDMDEVAATPPAYAEPDLTITAQFAAVDTNGNGGGPKPGPYGDVASSKDEMVTAQPGYRPGESAHAGRFSEGVPQPYRPTWQTAADDGWAAAREAASSAEQSETTQSGLPKRKPMAQLVPGGVDKAETNTQRRSPEGVRGLLSAYTRGVQRGRTQQQNDDVNPGSTEHGGQSGKEREA